MESKKNKSRATSYDVARLAGVSQSAVSRCFKPGASVSKKMKNKVLAAAKELHYQPNAIARGLITKRSNLVAVLVSSEMNFYYPEVLFQLTDRFSKQGLRVLLFTINDASDVESCLDQIWQYQADGVISASHLSIEEHKILEERQIPVVLFNRFFSAHPCNSVWCDPNEATKDMIQHLVDFGHQRFGILEGPSHSMVNEQRMLSVRETLKNHNCKIVSQASGNYRYESGASATQHLMSGAEKPTAIIAANDMMAMGVLDELKNVMGRSVPRDISVVGFDGIGAARFASYELTTIRQPIGRMTDAAVSMLLDRIEKPELSVEKRVLTGSFLQGTSSGPVNSK